MPDADFQADLDLLKAAAVEAGAIAMSFFRRNPKSWLKGKSSSVSEADMAVDDFLKTFLLKSRPDYGWLSEETDDTQERLEKSRVFVVDPIDGTRGYLEGHDHWCIALAVVQNGVPVAGVLAAPALKKTYFAMRGGGAFCNETQLDGKMGDEAIPLSAGLPHAPVWAAFSSYKKAPFVPSLALRLAGVASGDFAAAFARPDACDWDIAAAQLIVEEAGGIVVDAEGNVPRYNRQISTHPALGAFSAPTRRLLGSTGTV